MLTHVILVALAVLVCIAIARLEKSNKMFWMLLVSMLTGYAAAGVLSVIHKYEDKKQCVISVDNSTQTPTCSFQVLPAEGDGTLIEIKSVGKSNIYAFNAYTPNTCNNTLTVNMQNQPFVHDTS